MTLKKGGKHVLTDLNGLTHRCRKYLRRKKKRRKKKGGKKRCKKGSKKRRRKHRKKHDKKDYKEGYEIRGCVSCLDPPNHVHAIWDCQYIPQKQLSKLWKLVTGDSFIVDIRKVEKQRWKEYFSKICYYISKISRNGSSVGMKGVHVVNSWGDGGYYKKIRMVCKICGERFMPLWYGGQVSDYENDPVKFVVVDPG